MLFIVSTPIGNLEDISLRALRALTEADVIIAEDTRHTGLLLKHFQIPHKALISLYDEVESQKLADLLAMVASEQKVVMVSDAGTPLISDPGYKLVREAIKHGVKIEAIPGPTAVVTALSVSGLPPDKFIFLGYPPEKEGHQRELLQNLKISLDKVPATAIFYLSPYKMKKNLTLLLETFGDVEIVIERELTKVYEESWRGTISEAVKHFKQPRGEFVLLFHL